jgi:hypothetical protein
MQRSIKLLGAAVAGTILFAASSQALVLTAKSPEQKCRQAVAKAQAKYVQCITKATLKCEGKGTTADVECFSDSEMVAGTVDPKAAAKYPTDLAKCDTKLSDAITKKCTDADIVAAGCAGGSTTVAATIAAIENADGSVPTAVRNQLPALGGLLSLGCQTDTGNSDPTADVNLDCVKNNASNLLKGVLGILKCTEACEDDYAGSKGGGGSTDGDECDPVVQASMPYAACVDKTDAKIQKAVTSGKVTNVGLSLYNLVLPGVLATANDNTFNSPDMCP